MKLYYSITSPFARKVRIASLMLGLDKEIEVIAVDVFNDTQYKAINPLVKVPSLQTRDGLWLSNSPFILDYLDSLSSTNKVIPQDSTRWQALQFQSVADGIMDAAVLRRLESLRTPDKQDSKFEARQNDKINNGLLYFENNISLLKPSWTVAEITLLCALGYLELRFAHENWLASFPNVRAWVNEANLTDLARKTNYNIT